MSTRHHTALDIGHAFRVTAKTVKRYATEGCPHARDGDGRLWFNAAEVHAWLTHKGRSGRQGRPVTCDAPGAADRVRDSADASRLRRMAKEMQAALGGII